MAAFDVFLSYSHSERDWVIRKILGPLRHARSPSGRVVEVFFDTEAIEAGDHWLQKIESVIRSCRRFVPVWSPGYWQSSICRHELDCAHKQDPQFSKRFMVPILQAECEIPDSYHVVHYLSPQDADFEQRFLSALGLTRSRDDAENAKLHESLWDPDYSRSGQKLMRITRDNISNIESIEMLSGHRFGTYALVPGAAPNQIISGGVDKEKGSSRYSIKIWELDTGRMIKAIPHDSEVLYMDVSSDGSLVAVASTFATKLFDLKTGTERDGLWGHSDAPVWACSFAEGGRSVVSCAQDGTVRSWIVGNPKSQRIYGKKRTLPRTLWNMRKSRKPYYESHDSPVGAVIASPDPQYIVSKDFRGILKVWDPSSGNQLFEEQVISGAHAPLVLTPNGRFVVWENGKLDLLSRKAQHFDQPFKQNFVGLAVSPDGTLLVCYTYGSLVARDLDTGEILRESNIELADEYCFTALFSHDQRRIMLGGQGSAVHGHQSEGVPVLGVSTPKW